MRDLPTTAVVVLSALGCLVIFMIAMIIFDSGRDSAATTCDRLHAFDARGKIYDCEERK